MAIRDAGLRSLRMVKWKRRVSIAAVLLVVVIGAAAVGLWWWLRVPAIEANAPTAMALFARVLNGEQDLEPRAIAALAGAVEAEPNNARARLWYALANMHALIRTRELPYAIRASRAFDRAVELDPSDTSAAGWRAFFAYQAAKSRGEDLSEPRDALLEASARDPRFTPFLAAITLARMPLSSGYPQRVLGPLEAIEDCGDGTSYTCRLSPLFPHGAEGFHTTLGDLRVRLGDVEGGRRSYARALTMPNAATWPYRAAFVQWSEGAERRAEQLTNDDPSDDPPIFFATGPRACATCHEEGPDDR